MNKLVKKVLILGANGMAGHSIAKGLQMDDEYEVIAVARSHGNIAPTVLLDVSDFENLIDLINDIKPKVIINCVGILNSSAEMYPSKAILINSYLPHFLESITEDTDTKIIHISTDCVFSGKDGLYIEDAFKDGSSYYAKSKALGELENGKDLTIRTSIIGPDLNPRGIGLFNWFIQQKGIINGYTETYWTGITTLELMHAIKFAIREDLVGLYHLVNNQSISKYELLCMLNDTFNKGLDIRPCNKVKQDKSLVNTRKDFSYNVRSYEEMISEMKIWIEDNYDLYPHYINHC